MRVFQISASVNISLDFMYIFEKPSKWRYRKACCFMLQSLVPKRGNVTVLLEMWH